MILNIETEKMKVARFFRDSRKEFTLFVMLGIVAGAFNMGIIVLVNAMINNLLVADTRKEELPLMAVFLLCIFCWFLFRRALSFRLIDFTQQKLWQYRKGIITSLLRSDFLELKKNRHRLQTILTEDTKDVSIASVTLVDFIISIVTALCILVYLALLSLPFFFLTVLVCSAGIGVYQLSEKANAEYINRGRNRLDIFQAYLQEVVAGFKEIKVAEEKGAVIYQKIKKTGDEAIILNAKASKGYLTNSMIGQVFFYMLIAFLVAFGGRYLSIETPVVINFLFALLFLIGPLEVIMSQIPALSRGLVALERIDSVNRNFKEPDAPNGSVAPPFATLKIENLAYQYENVSSDLPFRCGPINFEVSQGQVVFISGGNGSGKTTFIHLLLGLLQPGHGRILVNGRKELFEQEKKGIPFFILSGIQRLLFV